MGGNNYVYLSKNGWGRGVIHREKNMTRRKKHLAKEMRSYILVSHVIDGGKWLHASRGIDVSYHSDTPFEQLDDGYTTECRIVMIFLLGVLISWIFMLPYVALFIY